MKFCITFHVVVKSMHTAFIAADWTYNHAAFEGTYSIALLLSPLLAFLITRDAVREKPVVSRGHGARMIFSYRARTDIAFGLTIVHPVVRPVAKW